MRNQESKSNLRLNKNYFLHLLFLLFISMTISAQIRVQSTTGSVNSGNSIAMSALTSTPVNGNTLIAVISTRGTSASRVSSITQTGATWSLVCQATNTNGSTTEIWYAPNVSGASKSISISLSSTLRAAAVAMEYSGLLTPNSFDLNSNSTGNSVLGYTGLTSTITQANELLIGGIGLVNSSYTIGTPSNSFANIANAVSASGTASNNARVYVLEKITTAIEAAYSLCTIITSSQWSGAIATFKAKNTVSAASSTPTICINTALTSITHTTTARGSLRL